MVSQFMAQMLLFEAVMALGSGDDDGIGSNEDVTPFGSIPRRNRTRCVAVLFTLFNLYASI